MRIGIHVGTIIGGVTGSKIVRYDIYGSDVMVSNKMESNETSGKINVSKTTKDLLEIFDENLSFEFNKHVKMSVRLKDVDVNISSDFYFVPNNE